MQKSAHNTAWSAPLLCQQSFIKAELEVPEVTNSVLQYQVLHSVPRSLFFLLVLGDAADAAEHR